jgi:hypothetical protein
MSKIKIPAQVYVTAKKQPIYDNYDNRDANGVAIPTGYGPPLGFLHPWNPKKPDDNKHNTQREWAYKEYINDFKCEDRGGHLWISGWKYDRSASRGQWPPNKIIIGEFADPQPMLLDNTPLPGFVVQRSVSRYSTSNKLWRILDPRGFELEITTGCMENIIDAATILKGGLIDANCVWAGGKSLVVV